MRKATTNLLSCAAAGLLLSTAPAEARPDGESIAPGQATPPAALSAGTAFDAGRRRVSIDEAQLALDTVRREHEHDSLALVAPLLDLAAAEARAGRFSAAAGGYAEAVRLVETLGGAMDRRLLEPLRGLGLSANAAGEYGRAAEALERALHVLRIQNGLYHLDQLELLDALSQSYVGLGREEDAELRQRTTVQLAEREHGADSIRMLPSISALAGWYHDQRRYLDERVLLERKIALLEATRGEHHASLIEPLRALALSYRLDFSPQLEGERALDRALEIHARRPDDTGSQAETLVALGDWHLVFRERMRAFKTYAEAYALLAADAGEAARMDRLFGAPVALFHLQPRTPEIDEDVDTGDIAQGFVLVEYAVNPLGRAVDIRLVESDPPGIMDHRVVHALRGARYRPRIAGGEPVRTEGLRLQNTFAFNRHSLASEAPPPDP